VSPPRKEARKAQVLDGIALFWLNNGIPPSYRDIAEYMGISHSLVHGYVKELRADGLIDARNPKLSRALNLTDAGRAATSATVKRWETKPSLD
jgi:Mn-dependent DtxR family transcriptional regulator